MSQSSQDGGTGGAMTRNQKVLLALSGLPLAALILPTLIVVGIGMLPTASALFLERGKILARRHLAPADSQEVRQNSVAGHRGDGFRMELHAV